MRSVVNRGWEEMIKTEIMRLQNEIKELNVKLKIVAGEIEGLPSYFDLREENLHLKAIVKKFEVKLPQETYLRDKKDRQVGGEADPREQKFLNNEYNPEKGYVVYNKAERTKIRKWIGEDGKWYEEKM